MRILLLPFLLQPPAYVPTNHLSSLLSHVCGAAALELTFKTPSLATAAEALRFPPLLALAPEVLALGLEGGGEGGGEADHTRTVMPAIGIRGYRIA